MPRKFFAHSRLLDVSLSDVETPKRFSDLEELIDAGFSVQEVADYYGFSRQRAHQVIKNSEHYEKWLEVRAKVKEEKRQKVHDTSPHYVERVCKFCGKIFNLDVPEASHKYCSEVCRVEQRKIWNRDSTHKAYLTNEVYRQSLRDRAKTLEFREYQREYFRKRYHNDPEFRKNLLLKARLREAKKKEEANNAKEEQA